MSNAEERYEKENSSSMEMQIEDGHWLRGGAILHLYVNPVIFACGIAANLIVIAVFLCRKALRAHHSSVLQVGLAVVDIITLLYGPFRINARSGSLKDQWRNFSSTLCKTDTFIKVFVNLAQPWILINITVERFIVVFMPHLTLLITKTKVLVTLLLTLIINVLVATFPTVTAHVKTGYASSECVFWDEDNLNISPARSAIVLHIFTLVIPFIILLFGSLAIGWRYKKSIPTDQEGPVAGKRLKESRFLTRSLMMTSGAYLILMAPAKIVSGLAIFKYGGTGNSVPSNTPMYFFRILGLTLLHLNSALNVFFYAGRGGKFRQELIVGFFSFFKWCRPVKVAPASTVSQKTRQIVC